METPMLTHEQIEEAKRDRSHLVVKAIDKIGQGYWDNVYSQTRDPTKSGVQRKATLELIPFIQKIEGNEFELDQKDLITIWTRVLNVAPSLYCRYTLARSLSLVYSTCLLPQPWKSSPSNDLREEEYLSTLANSDIVNATKALERIVRIGEEIRHIAHYVSSSTRSVPDEDMVLVELKENFANALFPLYLDLKPIGDQK